MQYCKLFSDTVSVVFLLKKYVEIYFGFERLSFPFNNLDFFVSSDPVGKFTWFYKQG